MVRGMEADHASSPKNSWTKTMNSPSGRKYHGGKGETMRETLHPNELILTEQVLRDLVTSGLTKEQTSALKEQQERQKRVSNAASS